MDLDSLVISLLDSNATVGCFKKDLSDKLGIPKEYIIDVWLENDLVDGLVSQTINVSFVDVEISKSNLMDLDFKSICGNTIIFEVGDIFI